MSLLHKLINVDEFDISDIEEWIYDCECSEDEVIEFIRDQIEEDNEFQIWDVNIKLLVLEFIMIKAEVDELIEYINVDEESDNITITLPEKDIKEIMSGVLVEDRNDAWLFLVEYFGIDVHIEDEKD